MLRESGANPGCPCEVRPRLRQSSSRRAMKRYVVGQDRSQRTLFPEVLDDYIAEDNPVRVVDVFVDDLDLKDLGV